MTVGIESHGCNSLAHFDLQGRNEGLSSLLDSLVRIAVGVAVDGSFELVRVERVRYKSEKGFPQKKLCCSLGLTLNKNVRILQ